MNASPHYVAIFGGAISGAEAAHQLSQHGIRVAVFDQNLLPYGKIEDGLPKWHAKLRDKEEKRIDDKLNHPLVEFVPGVRLGREIRFQEAVNDWGFSAVLLAIGAWRDRPLPVDGIEAYLDKGFYYQNPFMYWFNHYHEPHYQGPRCEVADGALVIGGGLASIDVAKVLMIETVQRALRARGHEVDMFRLERSIAKVLEGLGLSLADLGLHGCTLFYRRRIVDMPLSPFTPTTPEQQLKAQQVSQKILANAQRKYLFHVKPLHVPVRILEKDGRLSGLVFQQTAIVDGRAKPVPDSELAVESPLVISSIGSLPEQIDGIPVDGTVYRVRQDACCRLQGFDHVFALGNAVTGRGNINESLRHGRQVAESVAEEYLATREDVFHRTFRKTESHVQGQLSNIANNIQARPSLDAATLQRLQERIAALQAQAGYQGDYQAWVQQHRPPRLEHLIA